jgi:hypothetical protein
MTNSHSPSSAESWEERRPIADVLDELVGVIEAVRGDRDVIRVSGLVGNAQDVGVVGIDSLQDNLKRAIVALRTGAPAQAAPEPAAFQYRFRDDAGVWTKWMSCGRDHYDAITRYGEIGHCPAECRPLFAAQPPDAPVDLTDPVVVHVNMLRGTIAKPTWEQIKHLYPEQFQSSAAAPVETPSYNLATGERDNEETDPAYFHSSAATGDALHDIKVLLQAIYDLIDDEDAAEPLDYAIAHAKKALEILATINEPQAAPTLPKVMWWNGHMGEAVTLADSLETYSKIRPGADRDKWAMRAAAKLIREVCSTLTRPESK